MPTKHYFQSLNGIRAISIGIVILYHYLHYDLHTQLPPPFNILLSGKFGVNVFFVISGFLITYLLNDEWIQNNTIRLKAFYRRRILRIFPAYYFLLLVYFMLDIGWHLFHFKWSSWITSLTFTKYLHFSDRETGHLWSLAVEEQFYLLIPVVFAFFRRLIPLVLTVSILLPFIVRSLYDYNGMTEYIPGPNTLFSRADAIAVGCLIAFYYQPLTAFLKRKSPMLVVGALVMLVLPSCFISNAFDFDGMHQNDFIVSVLFGGFFGSIGLVTNLCIGVLILYFISLERGLLFACLNSRLLNFIGKLSYSLYLWQQVFFSENIGSVERSPLKFLLIVIAAMFSYFLIERPFLAMKNNLAPSR